MKERVLIIDDEKSIRDSLRGALQDEGLATETLSSGKTALEVIAQYNPDVCLLDIWMPDPDGIQTLQNIKDRYPNLPIIMMSGHGTIETAVKATKLGAYDFIEKPLSLEKILVSIKNAVQAKQLSCENETLRKQLFQDRSFIGSSGLLETIKSTIRQIAPTTGSVLISGENGTGKELVAHNIHAQSHRWNAPFIPVNCAAIPEELIESELFGHEKGSFTGAASQKRGKFELADGGTLFLDEIGDMSLKTQAKILRVIQEQKFERIGGSETIEVDVRVVAATNKDLKKAIREQTFREDLFYRLNVIPIHVPPLRERRTDIPLLIDHYLSEFSRIHAKPKRVFSSEAVDLLEEYQWPGNVRELKNLVERIVILSTESDQAQEISAAMLLGFISGDELRGELIEKTHSASEMRTSLRDARAAFERSFILSSLRKNDGNVSKTASALGVERSHLHKKIKAYGIEI